jgi:hypothetical protein
MRRRRAAAFLGWSAFFSSRVLFERAAFFLVEVLDMGGVYHSDHIAGNRFYSPRAMFLPARPFSEETPARLVQSFGRSSDPYALLESLH